MKYYTTFQISENIHETPEGFLVCVGVPIARSGTMMYAKGETPLEVGPNGTIEISRDPEEIFRPETIASFEGKAFTITHPEEFVSPENWSRLAKGILQNVRRGEGDQKDDLVADILVTDAMAINLVKTGLREVSCGYEADFHQDGPGKGLQTNIVGNHLALVDEGRAGAAYAINDHKGKGSPMSKFKEKVKAIFAKAQDEAMGLAEDAETPPKKDEPAKEVAKDEKAGAYDELTNLVKDLSAKIEALSGGSKDASTAPTASEPAKVDAKDEEVAPSLEDRLKALEAAVAKMLENQAGESDESAVADADAEEGESDEAEDDDFEESTMVGDTASRVEILAPGLSSKSKDAKANAIRTAYATKDGKAIIDKLTGGKAPVLDTAEKIETIFIAASELLKSTRVNELSRTKVRDSESAGEPHTGPMTAEEMNARNAKHYGR